MSEASEPQPIVKKIIIMKNGSYHVHGYTPLVHKTQVVSENGEPLTWKTEGPIPIEKEMYGLCRCGQSGRKPFCDGTHRKVGFDGTETADTGPTAGRQMIMPGATRIIVKRDPSLCMDSGFCNMEGLTFDQAVTYTGDPKMRSLVIAMVERCPSGALTYQFAEDEPPVEPDLPQHVAVTTEITSDGPIAGPIWVMGGLPIERSDGQPLETRNRVTLCNCGRSCNKPLCDGAHRRTA